MKKLIALFMAVLLCLSTVSCKQDNKDKTSQKPSEETPELQKINLTIAGNSLESYTVVYAKSLYAAGVSKRFTTEHDFFRLIANDIAAKIYEDTGIQLNVKQDTKTDKSEFEILVGPTNREESKDIKALDVYKSYAKVEGTKLVIGGGYLSTSYTGNLKTSYCYASTYHAYDPIDALLNSGRQEGLESLDIAADCDYSTTVDLVTVACIGDSITEGYNSSDWNYDSYPAVLQRVLWQDHLVINLGNSGRTMRDDLANKYRGTTQHSAMKKNAKKFDYALIMLGTNDSYFDRVWPSASDEKYLSSADNLVDDITSKNKDVKVVIMNCPVYYGNEGSGSPRVRLLQNELPERLENKGCNVTFFDMHGYTEKNVGRNNFPDLLHPNNAGYAQIAVGISEMLTELEKGTYTYKLPEIKDAALADPPKRAELASGAENLMSVDLLDIYLMSSAPYTPWAMDGAPYLYMDLNKFSGCTVTNIEIPVSGAKKGDTFTVCVVKYSHPNVTETLSMHKLTVIADCSSGYLGFDNLRIEVPNGYTLAFGKPSDSLKPLYLTTPTSGYYFYGSIHNSINDNATLAFNIYGIKQ